MKKLPSELRTCVALISAGILIASCDSRASMFGEETVVLLQMAANQLIELNRLAESVGIAKNHIDLLMQINEGVQQVTHQIQAIDTIVSRAKGLDPASVRGLSDINQSMQSMKLLSGDLQELIGVKLILCDQAVDSAGIQSDTAYKMGQEMEKVGSQLAMESQTASPGRAGQISASAMSAQMLATGVELQTLSQISQLLAMSLDLQKSQIQRELQQEQTKRAYMQFALTNNKAALSNVYKKPSFKGSSTRERKLP